MVASCVEIKYQAPHTLSPWLRLLDGVGVHEGPNAGSEYKRDGSVARGPAPKPLKLAKVGIDEQGQVVLEKWTEQDFRENV